MQPKATVRRARRLRKEPTRAEERLWAFIRDKAVDGMRFRRQVPIGVYVCDFACLSHRLIVEVDGGIHGLRTFDDARRDAWLNGQGFAVVRVPNALVMDRVDLVIAAIRDAARPPSVRLRLPRRPIVYDRPSTPEMGEGYAQ